MLMHANVSFKTSRVALPPMFIQGVFKKGLDIICCLVYPDFGFRPKRIAWGSAVSVFGSALIS